MPQMYPLMWMLMMPLSILIMWLYMFFIFFIYEKMSFKVSSDLVNIKKINWEW